MKTLLLFCTLTAAASAAFAQTAALDQVSQDPSKGAKADQQAARTAAAASSLTPAADVTFEQILASPDDVDLNERYALTMVRQGDLRGAATALERVLLNAPGRVRTRFLYGVVLLRLDDAPDALRQLDEALASPDLPGEVRPDALAYRRAAVSRLRDSHFDARLTLGAGYDSNRNVAPDDSRVLLFGAPATISPGPTADGNFQAVGSVGASYDFDGPHGDTLFGRFTDYRQDQRVVSLLSLQVYSPQVGATFRTRWADITPSYTYQYVDLSVPMALYMRSHDYDLRVSRRWDRTWETWADFTDSRQVFYGTPLVANGSDRSGDQFTFAAGAGWTPDPTDRLTLTLTHQRKFAVQLFDAYRREAVTVDYTRLFEHGVFALVGLTADFDRYEQPDPLVGPGLRSDDGYIPHAAFGAPLDLISRMMKGFTAILGVQYQVQRSSLLNDRYTNGAVNAQLSYQWGI